MSKTQGFLAWRNANARRRYVAKAAAARARGIDGIRSRNADGLTVHWGTLAGKQGGLQRTKLASYDGPRRRADPTWAQWMRERELEERIGQERRRKVAHLALAWARTFPKYQEPERSLFDVCQAVALYPSGGQWRHWIVEEGRHQRVTYSPCTGLLGNPRPCPYAARGKASQELALMVQQWRESRA